MTSVKVVLIGSPLQYNLIDQEILNKKNIEFFYTHKNADPKLIFDSNNIIYYDELTPDALLPSIKKIQPDALVCFNDNFLIQTAQLREHFGISGLKTKDISKFKLKSEMYKALNAHIDLPKTMKITTSTSSKDVIENLGEGEYFVKPDNLAGAEGTQHLDSVSKLESWFKQSIDSKQYVIQRYYNLPLVHCELYIQDGDIKYIQARRYSYPNHFFLQGRIIASFPIVNEKLRQNIEEATKKVASIMRYKNGVMHTEFFLNHNNSLIFLETNIRQAGGAINLIHKKRSGVSMETAMVLLELGIKLPIKEDFSGYEICGYIPLQKGQVTAIEFPKLLGHYDFDIRVNIGDICNTPKSASNTAVGFFGFSSSLGNLIKDFFSLENSSIIKYQNIG